VLTILSVLMAVSTVEVRLEDFPAATIQVPAAWTYSVEPRTVWLGGLYVLFAANNSADKNLVLQAHVEELDAGRRTSYAPEFFADQLVPGTVYVEVGLVVGRLHGPIHYAGAERERPNHDLCRRHQWRGNTAGAV
jgi:hypothetical protein